MTNLDKWFNSSSNLMTGKRTMVDSAGCKDGEEPRPARATQIIDENGDKTLRISIPEKEGFYIDAEDGSVDLGEWE